MKLKTIAIFVLIATFGAVSFYFLKTAKINNEKQLTNLTTIKKEDQMKILSPAFKDKQRIPAKFTCDRENINPPLTITDIPQEAQSLVLIMDDPDAPMGTWVHWLVWNINPQTTVIKENSVPKNSIQGTNSFNKLTYGGPCPPSGQHRYFFKLYALNCKLNLDSSAGKKELEKAMAGKILSQTELIGLYR